MSRASTASRHVAFFVLLGTACTPAAAPIRAVAADAVAPVAQQERAPSAPGADLDPSDGLWPAGTCGFDPYLAEPCEGFDGAPRFAVVLGVYAQRAFPARTWERMGASAGRASRALLADMPADPRSDLVAAERALTSARTLGLAPGYPFAISFDDLPPLDASRRGIAIVAGLYSTEAQARALVDARKLEAEVVPLAPALAAQSDCTGDWEECQRTRMSVVEIAAPTQAWSTRAIASLEARERDLKWVPYGDALARSAQSRAAIAPACALEPGRLFLTNARQKYTFMREYARVECPGATEAWVPWRTTRLESAVTVRARETTMHQVILVECDSPTIETRPFAPALPSKLVVAMGSCGD